MASFSSYLKNIFLIVLLVQIFPPFLKTLRKYYTDATELKTKIGVVSIKGTISESEPYARQLRKLFKDPEIKAIVLKIDSPGGTSGAGQALFQEINDLKQEHVKSVIAYSENVCASAAYYVACAADHIVTQPATLVGNIGAVIAYPNFQDLMEQLKIKYTAIETGTFKGGALFFKDLTPEQRAMFQSLTDDTYAQFIRDVAQRRPKLAALDPKKWADGKTFTGHQALQLGLIDSVGAQAALVRALRAKAPIEGEIVWITSPTPSIVMRLFGTGESAESEMHASTQGIIRQIAHVILELIAGYHLQS